MYTPLIMLNTLVWLPLLAAEVTIHAPHSYVTPHHLLPWFLNPNHTFLTHIFLLLFIEKEIKNTSEKWEKNC